MNPEAKELWDKIRNPNCTECPLHEEAQTVCLVGDGPVPAKMMIIGEAPGYREDEISKPFSGKSGRLLDETLKKHGLARQDVFITNVAKCRPPDNRTPTRTEIKTCRHYLDDEIEAVQPEFIMTVGNSGLSLVKKSGIMKHRGEVIGYGEAKVLPTVHPAAVLRNPRYGSIFDSDVRAFSRLVRSEPGATPPRVILVSSREYLVRACKAILKSPAVAYDIETNGFEEKAEDAQIACIGIAVRPDLAFVIPVAHPEARWKDPERVLKIITHALVYTSAKRVAHNAKFDDRWLCEHAAPIHADFDTMNAAHLLDENRMKGLEVLAQLVLGVDSWKSKVDLAKGGAMREPLKRLALYCGRDAAYTLRLYYSFREEFRREENVRTTRIFTKLIMPASHALTDIEGHGVWVDPKRLAKRRIKIRKHLDRINKELTKLVGYEANWNSPPQLARILFEEFKLPLHEVTKGGAPSTRESVLLRLKDEHPIAELILEHRKWAKNESTYLGKWSRSLINGRMYPNYKMTGTVTGRLSSGKEDAKDPRVGMQQVPRDDFIRGVIGAPPGWKFVEADFSQIELRIAAHISKDPTMMRLFQTGQDIHLATAVQLTGKPPEKIEKEERKKAKGVNFGFVYGMGWQKFIDYARDSYEVVVTETESKVFRNRFFQTFSTLPRWHDRYRRLVRQYYRVQSPIGRVRHLPDVLSEDEKVRQEAERQAINSPVQSLASDMMLLSMILLHAEMPPDEAAIVGSVHDSLLFEIREDVVDKWVPRIREVMENLPLKKKFGCELTVPIVVDIKVGKHWGEDENSK